jgi:hypothetical protein
LPLVFPRPLIFPVCGSISAARPLISGSLTQRFGQIFSCYFSAVSHWSAAHSGLDFVGAAAFLVSTRRYLFLDIWISA